MTSARPLDQSGSETPPPRRQVTRTTRPGARAIALALVTALVAGLFSFIGGGAAVAASGEYTVELSAPAEWKIYKGMTYDVTIAAPDTREDKPLTGVVLSAALPQGLAFDSVPTGSDSPVASASYDEATRTVTFVLKDTTQQLMTFTFSVLQVDNALKDESTTYVTSISGSATAGGVTPSDSAETLIKGNFDYTPMKDYTVMPGSGNRAVTYYYNIRTDEGRATTTETYSTWGLRLTDTIPAGARIVERSNSEDDSSKLGTWTAAKTPNADGSTTVTWESYPYVYGPSTLYLDSIESISLVIDYPPSEFPTGSLPPETTVQLDVKDASGSWHKASTASVQALPFDDGGTKRVTVLKDANAVTGTSTFDAPSGEWQLPYRVTASYLNDLGDGDKLDELVVTDSGAFADNGRYFDHADVYRIALEFNATLERQRLPFTLEYTTSAGPDWKSYDTTGLTTADDLRLLVQTIGSQNFVEGAYTQAIDLPLGEHMTGWRVVISPDASTSIDTWSEVVVRTTVLTSYSSLTGGPVADTPVTNTATATGFIASDTNGEGDGTKTGGQIVFSSESTATTNIQNRVSILTDLRSPTTLNVGDSASFVATISNVDPSGEVYRDSVMKVVLPVGVQYDAATGISPVWARTITTDLVVPTPGNGLEVTTETVTDGAGREHQVVVFTFDELPSLRTVGTVKDRVETYGFRYDIPVTVLPQAYLGSPLTPGAVEPVEVSSWAYTEDVDYANIPMGYWWSYYGTNVYGFGKDGLPSISTIALQPVVTTAGGLLLGKQVRTNDTDSWSTSAVAASPGSAAWQIYAVNMLPGVLENTVLFDRLPYVGDGRGTTFPVTVSGPVTGLPAGAKAEYSVDATSATTGTWTTTPAGATAVRVTIASLGTGENLTYEMPTSTPADARYDEAAFNDLSATGVYQGATRTFGSNLARVTIEGHPAMSLTKMTNGVQHSSAPGAVVSEGSTVEWTYTVTNTGDTPLSNVAMTDAQSTGGTLTPTSVVTGVLMPGDSRTFTATGIAENGQYSNVATATADPTDISGTSLGKPRLTAEASSWYFAGDAGLTVLKKTNGQHVASAPGLPLTPGASVTWSYDVTNTGTIDLTDVLVEDTTLDDSGSRVVVHSETIPALGAGDTVTITAPASTAIEGQYHNTVVASATNPLVTDPSGPQATLTAADDSWYFGVTSGVTIDKTIGVFESGPWSELEEILTGGTVYWQIAVTNDGNSLLSDVVVTDPELDQTVPLGSIPAGETKVVVIPQEKVTVGYTNEASVVATDPLGSVLNAEDDAAVAVREGPVEPVPTPKKPEPEVPGVPVEPSQPEPLPTKPSPTDPAPGVSPSVSTAPAPGGTKGSLPVTGAAVLSIVAAAVLLVAGGAAIIIVRRRRGDA